MGYRSRNPRFKKIGAVLMSALTITPSLGLRRCRTPKRTPMPAKTQDFMGVRTGAA
jgi:hypothetical protein